jgi:hypothetical protein
LEAITPSITTDLMLGDMRSRQRAVGDAAIHHELSRCQVSIEVKVTINQAQIEKGVEVGPVLYERL